jgi:signal transduction histidine kinase
MNDHDAARHTQPSLPDRVIFALLATAVAVILGAAAAFLARERAQAIDHSRLTSQVQAQLLGEHAAAVFHQAELGMRALFPLLASEEPWTAPGMLAALQRLVFFLPGIRSAGIFDAAGMLRLSFHGEPLAQLDLRPLLAMHRDRMIHVHVGSLPPSGQGPGWFAVSIRTERAGGGFGGVALVLIAPEYFAFRYRPYLMIDVDLVALYDDEGSVLASWTDTTTTGQRIADLPLLAGLSLDDLMKAGVQTVETPQAVASLFQLPDFPLRILLAYGKGQLLETWRRQAIVVGCAALLLSASFAALTLLTRRNILRAIALKIDLAASRERVELMQVFRRVALIAASDLALPEFLQKSLAAVRGFLGWPGALAHLRPPGIGLADAPVNAADGDDEATLRAAALEMEDIAISEGDGTVGPLAVPGTLAGVEAVLVHAREPGSPPGLFSFLTGGAAAAADRRLLEQATGVIYRTAVHRLEALERQRLQDRLNHARRVESLGVMAGGIAHELNNLLAIVKGDAEIVAGRLDPADPSQRSLGNIQSAARRGANISDRLLAAAGMAWIEAHPIDLGTLLGDLEPEVRAILPEGARLRLESAADPRKMNADARLLRYALLNLVRNSVEALPSGAGLIEILSGWRHYDRWELEGYPFAGQLAPGDYVWIEVRDDGAGMSDEASRSLFDPFSSTKFLGRGLGLPAVLGIVRQHRGAMRVQSREGAGTSVTILLPEA